MIQLVLAKFFIFDEQLITIGTVQRTERLKDQRLGRQTPLSKLGRLLFDFPIKKLQYSIVVGSCHIIRVGWPSG
jgi:hypothetical protein